MKLVSENSEAELAKRQADDAKREAEEEVGFAIRELAANLMRMTRGAGKPHESGTQANNLVKAYLAYKETVGHWPPSDLLTIALRLYRYDATLGHSDAELDNQFSMEQIVHGSLQLAASTLLDQPLQISAGKDQLHNGIRSLERAREERRRLWLADSPQKAQKTKKPPRKPSQP